MVRMLRAEYWRILNVKLLLIWKNTCIRNVDTHSNIIANCTCLQAIGYTCLYFLLSWVHYAKIVFVSFSWPFSALLTLFQYAKGMQSICSTSPELSYLWKRKNYFPQCSAPAWVMSKRDWVWKNSDFIHHHIINFSVTLFYIFEQNEGVWTQNRSEKIPLTEIWMTRNADDFALQAHCACGQFEHQWYILTASINVRFP